MMRFTRILNYLNQSEGHGMKIFFSALLIILSGMFPASANCWDYAASQFGIESRLLKAIALVESGMNPAALGRNTNGTTDIGLMQINSLHLKRLSQLGVTSATLTQDSCQSLVVGTSILADMMKVYGYSWEAVGAYNAGTRKDRHQTRMNYAKKVWQVYITLPAT